MTARGTRQGLDAEDLDVEEALALVKDGNGTARPPGGHSPAQRGGSGDGTPPSSSPSSPARSPEAGHRADAAEHRHRATTWPGPGRSPPAPHAPAQPVSPPSP